MTLHTHVSSYSPVIHTLSSPLIPGLALDGSFYLSDFMSHIFHYFPYFTL